MTKILLLTALRAHWHVKLLWNVYISVFLGSKVCFNKKWHGIYDAVIHRSLILKAAGNSMAWFQESGCDPTEI